MGGTFQKGQRIVFREAFLSPADELVQPGDTGTVRAVMLPSFVSVVDDKHQRVWLAKPSEIDALPEKANSEPEEGMDDNGWISVEERLPEPDTLVLAYTSADGRYVASYHEETILAAAHWWFLGLTPMGEVTHWRPLPPPPEQEET